MNNRKRTKFKTMIKTYVNNVYNSKNEKLDKENICIMCSAIAGSNKYVAPFYYNTLDGKYVFDIHITTKESKISIEKK